MEAEDARSFYNPNFTEQAIMDFDASNIVEVNDEIAVSIRWLWKASM